MRQTFILVLGRELIKTNDVLKKMKWTDRMLFEEVLKHSTLHDAPYAQEINNSKFSGNPWNWPDIYILGLFFFQHISAERHPRHLKMTETSQAAWKCLRQAELTRRGSDTPEKCCTPRSTPAPWGFSYISRPHLLFRSSSPVCPCLLVCPGMTLSRFLFWAPNPWSDSSTKMKW